MSNDEVYEEAEAELKAEREAEQAASDAAFCPTCKRPWDQPTPGAGNVW